MNKFLAVLFLAGAALAAPEAEADPALLYGSAYGLGAYGYSGLGYLGGYLGYPYATGYANLSPGASTSIAGLAPAAEPAVKGGYAGQGRYVANSAGVLHVAKREAEADPALLYGAGYGLGYTGLGYAGLGYAGLLGYAATPAVYGGYVRGNAIANTHIAGLDHIANPAVAGGYATQGRYVANSAGVVHVAKREAEADPALLYGAAYGLGAYGYAGLGAYGYGYAGFPYTLATGYANVSPAASTSIAGLAAAAKPAVVGGYAAAGRYVANSAGVVHVA